MRRPFQYPQVQDYPSRECCGTVMETLRTLAQPYPLAYYCRKCGREEDGKPYPGDRLKVSRGALWE